MQKLTTSILASTLSSIVLLVASAPAFAAAGSGEASLHFSPSAGSYAVNSTFTVSISETSSVPVAAVESDITYTTSNLQCLGIDTSTSAFATSYQNTCSGGTVSIARGVQGSTVTGTQNVARITFKVLDGSGSTSLIVAGSSEIDDASVNNVCDSTCAGGNIAASFSLTTPAPQPAPSSTPSKPSAGSSHAAPNNAASDTQAAAPAPSGVTLADTSNKTAAAPTKTAEKKSDVNWRDVAAIFVLLAILAVLAFAIVRWIASHTVNVSITPKTKSKKRQVQKPASKPAKKSKR